MRWWMLAFLLPVATACGDDKASSADHCRSICEKFDDCEFEGGTPSVDDCVDNCVDEVDLQDANAGDGCGAAYRDALACVAGLDSCSEVADYLSEPTENYPCHHEDEVVDAACVD